MEPACGIPMAKGKGLKYWQQGLLRIGANYKLNDNVIAHIGYAWQKHFLTEIILLLTTVLFLSIVCMNS